MVAERLPVCIVWWALGSVVAAHMVSCAATKLLYFSGSSDFLSV